MEPHSPRRNALVADILLIALLAVVATVATWNDLRKLPSTVGANATRMSRYEFASPQQPGAAMTIVTTGCLETRDAIFVAARASCRVEIRLTRDGGERGLLMLKLTHPEGTSNTVYRVEPGGESLIVGRNVFLTDAIQLPMGARSQLTWPEIVVTADNPTDKPGRIIYDIEYSTFRDASVSLVDFRRLYAAWAAVVFAALGLRLVRPSRFGRGAVVMVALMMVGAGFLTLSLLHIAIIGSIAAGAIYFMTRGSAVEVRRSLAVTAVLWAIGLLFVYLRYRYLAEAVNARLDPDAEMYAFYANRMILWTKTGFFSGQFGEREPFYILIAHTVFKMIGSSDLHLRYASFLCALPIPFLTYWLARESGARRIASAVAAFAVTMATEYLRNLPSRGLRDDLFMTVSSAFILTVIMAVQRQSKWRWIPVAAAGIVCMWTRTPTLLFAACLFAWILLEGFFYHRHVDLLGWAKRWRVWEAAVCLVLIYLSFLPIRMAWKTLHGVSDYPERGYARWNANVEFQNRLGTPGFATREQFQITPYKGPPITMRQYLFGLHTPRELVIGSLQGLVRVVVDLLPDPPEWPDGMNTLVQWVLGILIVGSLLVPRARILTMAALAALSYAAFFYLKRLIEPRSVTQAIMPLTAAALLTVDRGIGALRRESIDSARDWLKRVRHAVAPRISALRMTATIVALAVSCAIVTAVRFHDLSPAPSSKSLTLDGFYWKAAGLVSWPVASTLPWVVIAAVLVVATAIGVRWWAAVAVAAIAAFASLSFGPQAWRTGQTPRTYLWQRGESVDRVIPLTAAMRGRPAYVRFYVREPFRTSASDFTYQIEVDGRPIQSVHSSKPCPDCLGYQWREVAVPAAMTNTDHITVTIRVMSSGDQSSNYVDLPLIPHWRMGTNRWNGSEDDLSAEPGVNHGTILIGLTFPRTPARRAIPLWLGK